MTIALDPTMLVVLAQQPEVPDDQLEELVPGGITASDWIQAGILVVVAILLAVTVHRVILRLVTAGSSTRLGVARLLGRLAGMLVFMAGLVYALNTLGVRIGPVLGALGIVGIALAFALQDILENFIAGVILQVRNPFNLGDQVVSGEWQGTVEDVNFRAMVLHTVDGTRVVLPSSMVLKEPIQNLTAFEHRRTDVAVGVAYGTDLGRARSIITEAVGRCDGVIEQPAVEVYLEELGESSVNFSVRYWHEPRIASMWKVRDAVIGEVYHALGEADIDIPFPQRTLSFLGPVPVGAGAGDDPDDSPSS